MNATAMIFHTFFFQKNELKEKAGNLHAGMDLEVMCYCPIPTQNEPFGDLTNAKCRASPSGVDSDTPSS